MEVEERQHSDIVYESTSHPTGEATWNPALRRNSEADPISRSITNPTATPFVAEQDDDDDFFARYPGATPKKSLPQASGLVVEGDEQQAEGEELDGEKDVARRKSISVEQVVDIRQDDATPEELMRVPSNHVAVEGPIRGDTMDREEDEEAVFSPEETVQKQKLNLDRLMDETTPTFDQEHDRSAFGLSDEPMIEEALDLAPSGYYEHQSDPTALEAALEPSADVPLMEDEEPLPTPGYVSREPTFGGPATDGDEDTLGLDGEASPRVQPQLKSAPAQPSLDRSFTTNFSNSPIDTAVRGEIQQSTESRIPDDWPSVGDDKTFGELLENSKPTATEQVPAEHALLDDEDGLLPEEDGEIPSEDLAAAWGAAIDDDELLDETPASANGIFDPSAVFGEDDSGFLEDEPAPAPTQQSYTSGTSNQQPFSSGHGRSAGTPSTGLDFTDIYNSPPSLAQQRSGSSSLPQRPAMQPSAQSFVDKAKGGYQSPYDLPMDVVKPRRRPQQTPQQQQPAQFASPPPPSTAPGAPFGGPANIAPPRSSSMSSSLNQARALPPQTPTATPNVAGLSPPTSSDGAPVAKVTSTPKTAGSGFFEDLPVTAKPRQRHMPQQQGMAGMPTPPPQMPPSRENTGPYAPGFPPTQLPQGGPVPGLSSEAPIPPQQSQQTYGGLQRPEQMPLLPTQPGVQSPPQQQNFAAPPQNTRYTPSQQRQVGSPPSLAAPADRFSPAPPPVSGASAGGRYSPAPAAGQVKSRNASLPFAPRTSSPLAGGSVVGQPSGSQSQIGGAQAQMPASPPRLNGIQGTMMSPERSGSKYAPNVGAAPPAPQQQLHQQPYPSQPSANFVPPPARPRTQSPDTTMKGPRANAMAAGMVLARASSSADMAASHSQQSALPQTPSYLPNAGISPKRPALPHRRQFSRDLTFAVPQDERSLDPLQRWKGHPVFHWNASGTIVTTFPKQTPYYSAGQGLPSVKCTPGHITVQDATTFLPLDERTTKFPGPLVARKKGMKKELGTWIVGKIEDLDREAQAAALRFEDGGEAAKRAKEKVVLWNLLRIFVENDGTIEGNPKIEEEIRKVLLPDLAQMAQVADLQSPASAAIVSEPADKQVLLQIRQALLEGQRERAVWLAEEKKLWGHAMLIASTMGPETWKAIASSFIRAQVQSVGSDARSTAALYQVFAGNSEECVDELVPPSARAGFRMVAKGDGRIGGNPLEGLDQWRETLGLVVGNRTAGDGASLKALGKLLAGYERVEAAGACFLFARQAVKVSGADDAETDMVLLGGGKEDVIVGSDLDAILATEIFEYACSLSAPANAPSYLPHLQAYKLMHAQHLAACGLKAKASAYTEAITAAYTSTTRPSGYYHPLFTSAVAEFNAFLSQTPQDGKAGSFFSKPAMKTVSSGAASWFTKFVAGDEDSDSNASGGGGALSGGEGGTGPFGGVSGESPELGRSASGTDLYAPAMGGFAPSSAPTGRYAPGAPQQQHQQARYAPPGSSHSSLGIPAAESQRPSSGHSRYAPAPSPLAAGSLGVPRPDFARRGSDHSSQYAPLSRRGSAQETTSSQGSYEPRPVLSDDAGSGYIYSPAVQSPLVMAHDAPAAQEPPEASLDMVPNGVSSRLLDDATLPDAEVGGYEPPTASSGYEPPSYSTYQPYEPEPDSTEDEAPKAKKKTFGDDDDEDDLARRAAALKSQQKSAADRAADDAFRKAAEADAARDKAAADGKKGWLSGWWGKKDPSMPTSGPIKAKLGEENSFYYDEDLKKWVNKKGGPESAAASAPTPPPPRAASRVASGPPMSSGPPSRASSGMAGGPPPSALAAGMRPPTSASMAPPGSGPPSRTATPASEPGGVLSGSVNGDTLPTLPPFSAATAAAVAPPGRPSSSLSTASSIDDLLGGPPGAGSRKGGTVKGKKKGGRYVDVMAK